MEELQDNLDNCINWFGYGDIVTIMFSQKLDKFKVEEQLKKMQGGKS